MSATVVRYVYSYLSPYSYLADCRLAEVLAPFDVELEYLPVLPPPREDGKRLKPRSEAEASYILEDSARVAARFGIPYARYTGYPDCEKMSLGFHAVRQASGDWLAYHKAAFAARFVEPVDPAAEPTLRALAAAAGVDGDAFLAALETEAVRDAYMAKAMEAVQCGLFGVPLFVLPSGERFWGQDRLEYVARALESSRA